MGETGEAITSNKHKDFSQPKKEWELSSRELNEVFKENAGIKTKDVSPAAHPHPKTLEEVHEALSLSFKQNAPIFIRWSPSIQQDIERGFSRHILGQPENGISVNELAEDYEKPGGHRSIIVEDRIALAGALTTTSVYELRRFKGPSAPKSNVYLLTGRVISRGSDGEPLLDAKTIKVVSEIEDTAMNEAELVWSAATSKDYPQFREGVIEKMVESRKGDILEAYVQGENIPQEILDEFPDIEQNEVARRQREAHLKNKERIKE